MREGSALKYSWKAFGFYILHEYERTQCELLILGNEPPGISLRFERKGDSRLLLVQLFTRI